MYGGDTNDATSTSSALTETIQQIGSTTLLAVDINPANAGATIHLTATVQMAAGATAAGALTGQVTFMDSGTSLGTAAINTSGIAVLAINTLSVGTHSITAVFAGNTNYAGSTSPALSEVINATATTTNLSASAASSLAGKPVVFTATVTSSTLIPTGTVTFRDGGVSIGTGTLNAQGVATLSITTLSVGNHSIVAVYGGDPNYITSTSVAVGELISLATPALTLTGPVVPINAGTVASFVVSLTTNGVAPTGTLTLLDGTAAVAAQAVSAVGVFTFNVSSLTIGAHTLTAVYSGDANNATATSNPLVVTVQQAASATALLSNHNPQVVGQSVTFTATVSSVSPSASGTVSFLDGASSLGSTTVVGGVASFTTSSLAFGTHSITAVYSGDTNHATSTSAAITQQIVQAATAVVTSSLNPAPAGANVVFTVSVAGVGSLVPSGVVTFLDGVTVLGTGTLDAAGKATFQTSTLAVANHPITVTYPGDANYSTAVSPVLVETVQNDNTQVTLTSSANPATYGVAVLLTATVKTNGAVATGTVTFTDAGTLIGSGLLDPSGVATLSIATMAPGTHTIVVNYPGDSKASASVSIPLVLAVLQSDTVTVNASANPAQTLSAITFTATIANAGVTVPTGTVVFTDGSVSLGSATVDATGHAAVTLPFLAAGSHSIVAAYSGDNADFSASSATLAETVNLRPTTTGLTATATNPTNAQQVTLIAVVRWTGTVVPTGTVTFKAGSTVLGSAKVDVTGVATLTVVLQSTTSSIVASYSGDTSYAGSDSIATSITTGPVTQFSLSLNPSSLTVASKQHGTVQLTVQSVQGFSDTLQFGCLGLPYAATCTFSATQMALKANGSGTVQLTIDTGNPLGAGGSAKNEVADHSGVLLCGLPVGLLACCVLRRKRRVRLAGLLMALFALAATMSMTGCAGLTVNGTPAGTYTFQVSAQGQSGASQSQTMTLTVTQ